MQFKHRVRDSLKAQGFDLATIPQKYRARLTMAETLRLIGEPEAARCYEGRMN